MANIIQLVKYLNNLYSSEEKIQFPLYEYYVCSFEVLASEVRKCVLAWEGLVSKVSNNRIEQERNSLASISRKQED